MLLMFSSNLNWTCLNGYLQFGQAGFRWVWFGVCWRHPNLNVFNLKGLHPEWWLELCCIYIKNRLCDWSMVGYATIQAVTLTLVGPVSPPLTNRGLPIFWVLLSLLPLTALAAISFMSSWPMIRSSRCMATWPSMLWGLTKPWLMDPTLYGCWAMNIMSNCQPQRRYTLLSTQSTLYFMNSTNLECFTMSQQPLFISISCWAAPGMNHFHSFLDHPLLVMWVKGWHRCDVVDYVLSLFLVPTSAHLEFFLAHDFNEIHVFNVQVNILL